MAATARFALKAATADAHERLDALVSRFDLTDPAGYGGFLRAQAGALIPVEVALDRADAARYLPDWPNRKRAEALSRDLAALGLTAPAPAPVPEFSDEPAILGAVYVLEGSRLGGVLLERAAPDTMPKAFLAPGNPAAWRAFVSVLDERLSSASALDRAAASAASVFGAFEASARNILGADRT